MTEFRRGTAQDIPVIVAMQRAAYDKNRALLGVEPLPLQADYSALLKTHEVWLLESSGALAGLLILEWRPDDLLIWNVSTAPAQQGRGLGNRLLAFAEERAREGGRTVLRLYTGEALTGNIAWYGRQGYVVERIEQMSDRRAVHMKKTIQGRIE
jgi:ribosomal protein S18 acetylase RimI-like enzyme